MIRIFAYLFNLAPLDVKMALLDKECSVVKDANTCVQVYFKSGAGEPILARGEAHIAPGLSLHGFCIEVDSICPQRLISPGNRHVTPGPVSLGGIIVTQRVRLDVVWKVGSSKLQRVICKCR